VLLFVTGTTPQIVTETIWGLSHANPEFMPESIHVLTTTHGQEVTERLLLGEGRLQALCDELGIAAPPLTFHPIQAPSGEPLGDVRNSAENTILANSTMTLVRDLTSDPNCRLHASLSGGRKTMGFFVGYAMSLYGRPQDGLYHVMVPQEFERCRDFFYIPKVPIDVLSAENNLLSTSDASIEVANLPFLRLRQWVDEPILKQPLIDFGALTQRVQVSLDKPKLRFDDANCTVHFNEHNIALRPQLYALYRVFADACASQWPGVGPDGTGVGQCSWLCAEDFMTAQSRGTVAFLETLERVAGAGRGRTRWTRAQFSSRGDGSKKGRDQMRKLFNPMISRLKQSLADALLNPSDRRQCWIEKAGRNPIRYGLLLSPERIEFFR
jgi:CRISPR-associated protein (TIGR02584 family)